MEPWFSQRKSTVGELPEATNESLCEDIIPPVKRRCLRKFGRGLRWFLPLQAVSLHFRRLAPWPFLWLGCWSADCTLTLDTHASIPHVVKCGRRKRSTWTGATAISGRQENGANRARTSASSKNFSSRT